MIGEHRIYLIHTENVHYVNTVMQNTSTSVFFSQPTDKTQLVSFTCLNGELVSEWETGK